MARAKSDPPLEKVDAILSSPKNTPARQTAAESQPLEPRLQPGTTEHLPLAGQGELASIAGSVLRASVGSERRTLLVTSANAGEGKTTIASNIAYSLAQQAGARTVIVDANLHAPRLHDLFAVARNPGVESLLFNNLDPESSLHATDLKNLYFMTLGESEHGFLSMFNPLRVHHVLEQLSRLFHIMIFDGPPVFGPSDPAVIANCFNHVLLVVECERTRWEVVQSAKERLREAGGSVAGVILNRRRHYIPKRIYERMR